MRTAETPTRRVLMLDDHPEVLRAVALSLRAPNVEIVTCGEIEAAEAVLSSSRFDVLVTDLEVSILGGLEGMRLVRHVTRNYPAMRVVVLSGHAHDSGVVELATRLGAAAVLPKPVDFGRLRAIVHGEAMRGTSGAGVVLDVELLDDVLKSNSIRSVLQPIVSLSAGGPPFVPIGFECLARPQGAVLRNPEILFGYATRKERLFETDVQCLRAGLAEARALASRADIFLNTQPRTMSSPQFVETVGRMVEEAGFSPERIVFELTEQQTILDAEAFGTTLATLRDRGFRIALDDYGDGFSNLHLVRELRPDFLKISGSLCRNLDSDPYRQVLVQATAEMAARLGIACILESVETAAMVETARQLGVPYGQGYYFARPASAADLLATADRFVGLTSVRPPALAA